MRRILFLLLVVVLAWHLGPMLTSALPFIPVAAIASWLVPDSLMKRSAIEYAGFAFWIIGFWLLLPRLGALFGFAVPNARRYGGSKFSRRLQGTTMRVSGAMLCLLLVVIVATLARFREQRVILRLAAEDAPPVARNLIDSAAINIANSEQALHSEQRTLTVKSEEMLSLETSISRFVSDTQDCDRKLRRLVQSRLAAMLGVHEPVWIDFAQDMPGIWAEADWSDLSKSWTYFDRPTLPSPNVFLSWWDRRPEGLWIRFRAHDSNRPNVMWIPDRLIMRPIVSAEENPSSDPNPGEPIKWILDRDKKHYPIGTWSISLGSTKWSEDRWSSAVTFADHPSISDSSVLDESYGPRTELPPVSDEVRARVAEAIKHVDAENVEAAAALKSRTSAVNETTKSRSQLASVRSAITAAQTAIIAKRLEVQQQEAALAALRQGASAHLSAIESRIRWIAGASVWARAPDTFIAAWLPCASAALLMTLALRSPTRRWLSTRYERIARFLDQGRFGLGGSARFACLFEEWGVQIKDQSSGLFMGRSLYDPMIDVGLQDPRHMLTIAGSRSGKGTTSIIPNLLIWKGSALVIDPKGTNAAVTARARREMGQDVHVVDPFDVLGKGECASFNPLAQLDPKSKTIREQINVIAEAIVVQDPSQKDRHWDEGARTIVAGFIGHLISSPDFRNPTLAMIRELLSRVEEEQDRLWARMLHNKNAGGTPRDTAARLIRGSQTNEVLGLLSSADKHTEWLSSEAIQRAIGQTTFTFDALKTKPTTIYLVLPPHYLETHKRFLRLFVNIALSQMSVGGRSQVPVLMILDEFLALGRMEEVEKAMGLMAGYNLTIWPFVQDYGRLKDLYGKSVNAFTTNSRAIQVFGAFDEETTEFVSKKLGNRSLESVWGGLDQQRRGVPLRDPSEVARDLRAEGDRQYVIPAGGTPMILEKSPYYIASPRDRLHERFGGLPIIGKWLFPTQFKGRFDPDPDYPAAA